MIILFWLVKTRLLRLGEKRLLQYFCLCERNLMTIKYKINLFFSSSLFLWVQNSPQIIFSQSWIYFFFFTLILSFLFIVFFFHFLLFSFFAFFTAYFLPPHFHFFYYFLFTLSLHLCSSSFSPFQDDVLFLKSFLALLICPFFCFTMFLTLPFNDFFLSSSLPLNISIISPDP